MLRLMDSPASTASTTPTWPPRLPSWTVARGRDVDERDAAFSAGIALKSLDDLIRAEPGRSPHLSLRRSPRCWG